MSYVTYKDYTIIKKHWVMLLFYMAKFIFFLLIVAFLTFFTYEFKSEIWDDFITYFVYPWIIVILTYWFLKLMLNIIFYFNDLVLFIHDKIIIVKSSLFLQDDLEIIDVSKVMKIDVQCHGFISNLIWYWNLVIEQQRDELRILHFIPKPYLALQLLREKTAYVNDSTQNMWFFKLN